MECNNIIMEFKMVFILKWDFARIGDVPSTPSNTKLDSPRAEDGAF